jgi:glycosyltransferase involved in cell wall biosynthesis
MSAGNADSSDFEALLERIAHGYNARSTELLPYLCSETVAQRCEINARLALAYCQSPTDVRLQKARVFIQRAWVLSGFADELIPVCHRIYSCSGHASELGEVYKRAGMKKAEQGNVPDAIHYFGLWQNVYGEVCHLDRFAYDFDVLDCIERLVASRRFYSTVPDIHGRRVRLAYLVKGITEVNSVLLKINLLFARFHDKSRFDVSFYVPETEAEVMSSPQGAPTVRLFQEYGCTIVFAPDIGPLDERLIGVAKNINETRADVLITSAALTNFSHYFIAALRPAPLAIAFVQGPPPQFVSPIHDWGIAWTKHQLIDCPVGGSHIPIQNELPELHAIDRYRRQEFDLPENGCVLLSAGRLQKFQDPAMWRAAGELLDRHSGAHFVIIGATEEQLGSLLDVLSPSAKSRLRFFGWRADYLRILGLADIVIDTFPSGGGFVLLDAAALGIPFVSFENNYEQIFDQTDWSVAEEHIPVPQLIVPRRDFEAFKRLVSNLIEDASFRECMGKDCYDHVREHMSHPEETVRRCEAVYLRLIENRQSGKQLLGALARIEKENLRITTFQAWQDAYARGYAAGMGDHRRHFYDSYLLEIGYYAELAKASRIVEFAPGSGTFIQQFVKAEPQKRFYLVEIAQANLEALQRRFAAYPNVTCILNDRRMLPLSDIDSVFSVLLCQSMPRTLWIEHLAEVYRMLAPGGSYVFQFAHHSSGGANDSVPESIAGSQVYTPEAMTELVHSAGFRQVEFRGPVDLTVFNTDTVWHFCRCRR